MERKFTIKLKTHIYYSIEYSLKDCLLQTEDIIHWFVAQHPDAMGLQTRETTTNDIKRIEFYSVGFEFEEITE